MKAIIPAKACSTRVPSKNYREFYQGDSLVDLLVKKLLKCFDLGDIYLSCEDPTKAVVAKMHGIQFIQRDAQLADNDTPMAEWIRGICGQVPGDDDVMWCECIDPLFDEHEKCIRTWNSPLMHRPRCDSLVVIHPTKQYTLDANLRPVGFGFGPWHVKSQRLPIHYRLNFTCSILTRKCIAEVGYMVGAKPHWYAASSPTFLDIDTEADFRIAQHVYAAIQKEKGLV